MKMSDLSDLNEDGRIVKGVNTTPDVSTDEIKTQAAKFGFNVDKDGRPPTLSKKVKGKSTNVLFNLGLAEGYKLQLERDKKMLVLNIKNTTTGQRTEVRGKPGYETGGYDPNDDLHQLLDTIGKSVDISQLMNGEPVGINPKHPDGAKAKTATDKAYNERFTAMEWAIIEGGHSLNEWVCGKCFAEPCKCDKTPGDLFTALENFADGKVKGKSRPGRVKRSGASCNGSVTALRKRAKNASGEKAKMYHWCANMKSGRKKK
jgi:hypothetical protein